MFVVTVKATLDGVVRYYQEGTTHPDRTYEEWRDYQIKGYKQWFSRDKIKSKGEWALYFYKIQESGSLWFKEEVKDSCIVKPRKCLNPIAADAVTSNDLSKVSTENQAPIPVASTPITGPGEPGAGLW